MGVCLGRQTAHASADSDWQALLIESEPYATLIAHYSCSTTGWTNLPETCRSGSKVSLRMSKLLASMLAAERVQNWERAHDLRCLMDHFNAAKELFQGGEPGEEQVIAAFVFRTATEAYAFLDCVIDCQERHGELLPSA